MKKLIKKYWGVGLVIVLLSSLFIAAAPVSGAEPLRWEGHFDGPSGGLYGLVPGSNILDYAIGNDGATYYAVTGTQAFMATGGAAMGWTDITDRIPGFRTPEIVAEATDLDTLDLVAVAPDDPNIVVIIDASANATNYIGGAISSDGAVSFSSLGQIGTLDVNMAITGVEISPMVAGGYRYVALFGKSAATDSPVLYYYNFGAAVGSWQEAVAGTGWTGPTAAADIDNIQALAFSPNFPSDFMAVVLSAQTGNGTANGTLRMHIASFNAFNWDADTGYPVSIFSTAAVGACTTNAASVALLPDYDGGDESLRIAFVGASINDGGTEEGGVWRCYDYINSGQIFGATVGVGINSLAYDGTNLAAGGYIDNTVYRTADPLATSPTFLGSRSMKEIGVDQVTGTPDTYADKVQLKFMGEVLYGAKVGSASALSKSLDYGNTWNDFTLMDSGAGFYPFIGPATVTDVYFTDAGPWYLAAYDGGETSVYRTNMFATTRVLCVTGTLNLKLRGVADDPDVVYAAAAGAQTIYYTADGGTGRWYKRTAPAAIADLAVESAQVVYIGSGAKVYKSVTAGFTWGLPVDTKVTVAVYSLNSLGENNLLVGGTNGGVTYSTDGGATFSKTFGIQGTSVMTAATGLGLGDSLFAADGGSNAVYRQVIGTDVFFLSMNAPTANNAEVNTGILLTNGVLYALAADSTANTTELIRTLDPTVPVDHPERLWGTRVSTATSVMNATPYALKVHAGMGGSIQLEAVDKNYFGGAFGYDATYYFDDNVALTGPALTGPEAEALVAMNSISGNPYNVNIVWSRLSFGDAYQVELALDSGFTSKVNIDDDTAAIAPYDTDVGREVVSSSDSVATIIAGTLLQPGATYYYRIRTYLPIASAWSETRSFTVAPGAAAVPAVASPVNGASIDNTAPAFSWSPVSQATLYEFQLAADTTFASPLVSEQLANTGIQPAVTLDRGATYFWRVRAIEPVLGDWSTIANFTVAELAPAAPEPVVIEQTPAPVINIPEPPPATVVEIPPAPAPEQIAPAYIWAIIIIGAVLVIAVIVLIVRTRRQV